MERVSCKICGGMNNVTSQSGKWYCEYCGNVMDLGAERERFSNLYTKADDAWERKDFDEALHYYEQIVDLDPMQSEAHWGAALCRYGVAYVMDPYREEKMPTCNRVNRVSILNDKNYLAAIKHTDPQTRVLYEKRAREIERISQQFLKIVDKEKPYDVFISYKKTDAMGRNTLDSQYARKLYYHLTEKGIKVFFAEETLSTFAGSMYEPYIFAALTSAKVMVLMGSCREHFEAVWVKNEWHRFLALAEKEPTKVLIPVCIRCRPENALPMGLNQVQAMDADGMTFLEDVTNIVKKKMNAAPQAAKAGGMNLLAEKYATRENVSKVCDATDCEPELAAEVLILKQGKVTDAISYISADKDYQKKLWICTDCGAKNTHDVCHNPKCNITRAYSVKLKQMREEAARREAEQKRLEEEQRRREYERSAEAKREKAEKRARKRKKYFRTAVVLGILVAIGVGIYSVWKELSPLSAEELFGKMSGELTEIILNVDKTSIMYGDTVHLSFSTTPDEPQHHNDESFDASCIEYYIRVNGVDRRINVHETEIDYVVKEMGEVSFWAKYCNHTIAHEGNVGDILSDEVRINVDVSNVYYNGFLYETYGTGVRIVDYRGTENYMEIPSTINGKQVLAIGRAAFKNCDFLRTVILPNSVIDIGFGAFYGCNNLTEMTLPFVGRSANVTETRWGVFGYIFGDVNLDDDSMEKSETAYKTSGTSGYTSQSYSDDNNSYMFYFVIPKSIRKVTITNQTKIPAYAFQNCDLIQEIKYASVVTEIGQNAFQNCSALKLCDFAVSDTTIIGEYAFSNCTALTTYAIPDGTMKISAYAFSGCKALASIEIPNSVTTISSCAFKNCVGLTTVTVPDSVTAIGGGAFSGCNNLIEMTLPFVGSSANATETRWGVFGYIFGDDDPDDDDMEYSKTTYKTSGSAGYTSQSYYNNDTYYKFYFVIPKSIRKVTITNQTKIPAYAFQNCDLIQVITIKKPVGDISERAFENCTSLKAIYYGGTQVQWSEITFGTKWKSGAGDFEIIFIEQP